MVPSQPGIQRPIPQVHEVLDEGRLLKVGSLGRKSKSKRCAIIELRWIGDHVARVFVKDRCCRTRLRPSIHFGRGQQPRGP